MIEWTEKERSDIKERPDVCIIIYESKSVSGSSD